MSKKIINTKGKKAFNPRYIKLLVMEDLSELEVADGVFASTKPSQTTLTSDGHRSFRKLKYLVKHIKSRTTPAKRAHIHLPWVHCAIGNLKRILNGIHHHVNRENLQLYLDEFAYKFNRRKVPFIFDNLVDAAIKKSWG